MELFRIILVAFLIFTLKQSVGAQETAPAVDNQPAEQVSSNEPPRQLTYIETLITRFDGNTTVQETAGGIQELITVLRSYLETPVSSGIAFTLAVAGLISFTFQLVLTKLVVLMKGSINVREILSDLAGLLFSAFGLILAADHHTSVSGTQLNKSPAAIVLFSAAGAIVGLVHYRWAQRQEVNAVLGERSRLRKKKTSP
jgi:hypothetical protein